MSYNPYPIWDEFVKEHMECYDRMLWYHRSRPSDSPFWDKVKPEIKEGALNAQKDIQEKYPEMVKKFEDNPDFQHGFVSGTIAMMRLVEDIFNAKDFHDEEEDCIIPASETALWAVEEWPMLDS